MLDIDLDLDLNLDLDKTAHNIIEQSNLDNISLTDVNFKTEGNIVFTQEELRLLTTDLSIASKLKSNLLTIFTLTSGIAYIVIDNGRYVYIRETTCKSSDNIKLIIDKDFLGNYIGMSHDVCLNIDKKDIHLSCNNLKMTYCKLDVDIDEGHLYYMTINLDEPTDRFNLIEFRDKINSLLPYIKNKKGMLFCDKDYMYIKNNIQHTYSDFKTNVQYFLDSNTLTLIQTLANANKHKSIMSVYSDNYKVMYKIGDYSLITNLIDGECKLTIKQHIKYTNGFMMDRNLLVDMLDRINLINSETVMFTFTKLNDTANLEVCMQNVTNKLNFNIPCTPVQESDYDTEELLFTKDDLYNILHNIKSMTIVILLTSDRRHVMISDETSIIKNIIMVVNK